MAKSTLLREREVRAVLQLVGECRELGEGEFDEYDSAILRLLHDRIAPLYGNALAHENESSPEQLSARQREVLELLVEGRSDKQICGVLGLSRATVSEYCGAIYRHFGCNGRVELLAHFLRRHRPSPAVPGPFELDAKG